MSDLRNDLRVMGGVVYEYLAVHGVAVQATAHALGARRVKRCHGNASQLARRWPSRYTWWTGVARDPECGVIMMHSWVERDGEHFEITWTEAGSEYLGVPVPPGTITAGVMDGHPIDNIAWAAVYLGRALGASNG